jgi:hypothetical protein
LTTNAHLHAANDPELFRVPAVSYASILGSGAPGTDDFYRKKAHIGDIASRLGGGEDPVIEILYWYPENMAPVDIADFYSVNPIPSLQYRVLAAIPASTTAEHLSQARSAAAETRAADSVELITIPEHQVVQVMHHGPFAEEDATLERLGAFARSCGVRRSGPHHELHLDGFTRSTRQDTLRTILRDPVS